MNYIEKLEKLVVRQMLKNIDLIKENHELRAQVEALKQANEKLSLTKDYAPHDGYTRNHGVRLPE